eukprot:SAG22_NODE_6285_length_875_cov_0.827320_1_plen_166_part_10
MAATDFKHLQPIITQGEAGDCLYIVEEGECIVKIDGSEVGRLERGKFFGEQALLHDEPRNASVVASGYVKCFRLDRADFNALIMADLADAAQTGAEATHVLVRLPPLSLAALSVSLPFLAVPLPSQTGPLLSADLFLAQVPLLSKLDPNKRLQLTKVAVEKSFKDG